MKLYRVKIAPIAHAVIQTLCDTGLIEVDPEKRPEAELDLVAIMEEYLRRDSALREAVRENMSAHNIPYEQYGKVRSKMAEEWAHPTGDDVERFLARQMVENFMISHFVTEVFADDKEMFKKILGILVLNDVDEGALRAEAQERIQNIPEGTVDYELALNRAMKEVKKRHGLLQ
jgi:hypothetical protein